VVKSTSLESRVRSILGDVRYTKNLSLFLNSFSEAMAKKAGCLRSRAETPLTPGSHALRPRVKNLSTSILGPTSHWIDPGEDLNDRSSTDGVSACFMRFPGVLCVLTRKRRSTREKVQARHPPSLNYIDVDICLTHSLTTPHHAHPRYRCPPRGSRQLPIRGHGRHPRRPRCHAQGLVRRSKEYLGEGLGGKDDPRHRKQHTLPCVR
jgi:hypothetical protein